MTPLPMIRQQVRTFHRLRLSFRNSRLTAHLPVEPRASPSKTHYNLQGFPPELQRCNVLMVEMRGVEPLSKHLLVSVNKLLSIYITFKYQSQPHVDDAQT